MLIERAIELVASKTDLTDMFKNSNLSAKTNDFIMDSDSAVQRVFRDVDVQQDDTIIIKVAFIKRVTATHVIQ